MMCLLAHIFWLVSLSTISLSECLFRNGLFPFGGWSSLLAVDSIRRFCIPRLGRP